MLKEVKTEVTSRGIF